MHPLHRRQSPIAGLDEMKWYFTSFKTTTSLLKTSSDDCTNDPSPKVSQFLLPNWSLTFPTFTAQRLSCKPYFGFLGMDLECFHRYSTNWAYPK
ncbi:hypothetical protein MUG91_G32n46 [Manis pentadactyla]|nr:hypothetical protein MUG91_G32n46 [Manis pentadactyla]